MKIITAKTENGVYIPSEDLPKGILTQFDGVNYIVYEEGDTLPEQPVYEPVPEPKLSNAEILAEIEKLKAMLLNGN